MPNTTISFDIENVLLAELATSIASVFDRNDGESDVDLIKRYAEQKVMLAVNKKRLEDSTWTEAMGIFV